jgi:hypothetical protein
VNPGSDEMVVAMLRALGLSADLQVMCRLTSDAGRVDSASRYPTETDARDTRVIVISLLETRYCGQSTNV